MSNRGWRDDETDGFIPEMIKQYALKNDGSTITDFDLTKWTKGAGIPTCGETLGSKEHLCRISMLNFFASNAFNQVDKSNGTASCPIK